VLIAENNASSVDNRDRFSAGRYAHDQRTVGGNYREDTIATGERQLDLFIANTAVNTRQSPT
jgi:hypothetical protein